MSVYKYRWNNLANSSTVELILAKPLMKDMVFASLRTGEAHNVISVQKTAESGLNDTVMSEVMVQTSVARVLSSKELSDLRVRWRWEAGKPEFVILS